MSLFGKTSWVTLTILVLFMGVVAAWLWWITALVEMELTPSVACQIIEERDGWTLCVE